MRGVVWALAAILTFGSVSFAEGQRRHPWIRRVTLAAACQDWIPKAETLYTILLATVPPGVER